MAENNNVSKEKKLREDLKLILDRIQDLNKHLKEGEEEWEDTGEDVDEIKKEIMDISKDVDDTGEDVDEIKEGIEEIKEDIGELKETLPKRNIFSKILPDKFAFKDIAQQIVGAAILSAPFAVTEEVWNLARNLDLVHIIALILTTLTFDILLFYYTKYQKLEGGKFFKVFPARIFSIIIVTYTTSFLILTVLGVIGGQILSVVWAFKLIVLVGLFANIGAGTADLIR